MQSKLLSGNGSSMSICLLEGGIGQAALDGALFGNLERRRGNIYADNVSAACQNCAIEMAGSPVPHAISSTRMPAAPALLQQ